MSLIINEGAIKKGPPSQDLMTMSEDSATSQPPTTSAFTRVSHSMGVIPVTTSLREETTPTPASSTASDSPPTLRRPPFDGEEREDDEDREDESSNQGDNAFAWPTHNSYDEQRQLLGTEEESSDHATSDEEELMMESYSSGLPKSSTNPATLSSGKRSVWSITREQINYYTTQFFCLQSDPQGVIPGGEAKEFFEKSKLPITDLRKIWQLSDVSQDGCLSLEEFLTAMHLVVLKRNSIELPETLPPVLRPGYLKQRIAKISKLMVQLKPTATNPNKDLYNGGSKSGTTPTSAEDIIVENERLLSSTDVTDTSVSAKTTSTVVASASDLDESKMKDADNVSIVSSPGRPQPVNFDFHRPDTLRRDPTIIQPVAVRLSPDSPILQSSDQDDDEDHRHGRRKPSRGEVGYEKLWNTAGRDEHDDDDEDAESVKELKSSDTITSRLHESGPVSLPASRLTSSTTTNVKDTSPPPPPPRGSNPAMASSIGPGSSTYTRSHARSSSLDLNNLQQIRPPLPPPRIEPHQRMSSIASLSGMTRDCRALQCKIQEYREKNSVIARTINELHQEVSDALEERIALEYQLEQLKSFGDE